ncbi:hypothetical protein C8R46DRAFT_496707 [Mycena filopes]|nr:hypothetical protein C8R46DRAFT_496707 [Mycena filopes]
MLYKRLSRKGTNPPMELGILLHHDIAQAEVDELRLLVANWISVLLRGWAIDPRFPFRPLPRQFPLGDFVMRKTFQWRPSLSLNPADTRGYCVSFQHGPHSGHARGIWTIRSGDTLLGAVVIPREVHDHPLRSFAITAELVLGAMRDSVASAQPVGLSTEVVRHSTPDGPVAVQRFYLKTMGTESEFLRDVAVCGIQECRECATPLPHPGPNVCAVHSEAT